MAVIPTTTRPMVRNVVFTCPVAGLVVVPVVELVIAPETALVIFPDIAPAARSQAPAPNANSRMAKIHPNLSPGVWRAPGMSIIATKQNIAMPNSRPDQRTRIFVAMLSEAASRAKPKKYAQNNGHGMYQGTMVARAFAAARCSAPKTAKGAAKHRLLKATTFSRPRACAISSLAAHSATKKIRMPAPHIESTVGEISKNVARMVSCMWTASITWRAPETRLPVQCSIRLYNED